MAEFDLGNIFSQQFRAHPSAYSRARAREMPDDWELSPLEYALESPQSIDLLRQYLPETAGDTKAGRWLADQLPRQEDPNAFSSKLRRGILNTPLGGYSDKKLSALDAARAKDPEVRSSTVRAGYVPTPDGGEIPIGDSARARATQAAAVVAGDVASDGLRNLWWFLNAPQAIAQIATLHGLHEAGKDYKSEADVPLIKNRVMRMAATLPAVIGMSMAVGNAGRQPGYKAVIPSEADPTVTVDPLGEFAARYMLGRSGSLLPYDQFVQERPDVSRQEYEDYKQYLFGNAWPLKATLDGIQGPEVTFMGKSIPVATGILPAVAAVAGARFGANKAARRLATSQDGNQLQRATELRDAYKGMKRSYESPRKGQKPPTKAELEAAYAAYNNQRNANEAEVLKQTLLYSGGGLAATALAGQTLESIRRALKGRAPVEQPGEELIPALTPLT
jgi:hypothetical protein